MKNSMPKRKSVPRGELLVALLKDKGDFAILQEQGWYRIPVASAPRPWPPRWLAFYLPRAFGPDAAYTIRYYGEVEDIKVVKRSDLFPNELNSARSTLFDRPDAGYRVETGMGEDDYI
jgi:hypothetical protein